MSHEDLWSRNAQRNVGESVQRITVKVLISVPIQNTLTSQDKQITGYRYGNLCQLMQTILHIKKKKSNLSQISAIIHY